LAGLLQAPLGERERLGPVLEPQHLLGRGRVKPAVVRVAGDQSVERGRRAVRVLHLHEQLRLLQPELDRPVPAVVLGVVLLPLPPARPPGGAPPRAPPGGRGAGGGGGGGVGGAERVGAPPRGRARPPVRGRRASGPPASPAPVRRATKQPHPAPPAPPR